MFLTKRQCEQGEESQQEEQEGTATSKADGTDDGEYMDAPPSFTCPISVSGTHRWLVTKEREGMTCMVVLSVQIAQFQVMVDPVLAMDYHTYGKFSGGLLIDPPLQNFCLLTSWSVLPLYHRTGSHSDVD